MPQINRIRVNNVKYNFGTQYYDDFMMRFHCRNAIYDLANGGGKSLLMLLLLQNVIPNCTLDEKQPIEKLFRQGSGNTVIHSLIEWKLDNTNNGGYKYMTTGFCARKAKEAESEDDLNDTKDKQNTTRPVRDNASVEYFNYCIFYREFGENDIKNLPLAKNGERITYNGLKQYLRELEKNDFHVTVKIFDRKGEYQSFISKYGLYESEWEIIRGINKTEGHVRTYFETNYRTSRKVVEDLLIEEIIQKSFNNRLAVGNDEGQMAETLLDIKDTLARLSKKNAQISNYDRQMELLDEFSKYISGYTDLYEEKSELKNRLLNLLIQCRQKLYGYRKDEEEQKEKLCELQQETEKQQQMIQTAEVLAQQASLENMEELIAANEKKYRLFKEQEEQLKRQLDEIESLMEYREYLEYKKLFEELTAAIEVHGQKDEELLKQLELLTAAIKPLFINEKENKEKELLEIRKLQEQKLTEYNQTHKEYRELLEKRAAAMQMISYTQTEIKALEQEAAVFMEKAGILVMESAESEQKSCKDIINTQIEHLEKIEDNIKKTENQLLEKRDKQTSYQTEIALLEMQCEQADRKKKQEYEEKQKIEQLKAVYGEQDTKKACNAMLESYRKMQREWEQLSKESRQTEQFLENMDRGVFAVSAVQYEKVGEYLAGRYGEDVKNGKKWLDTLSETDRQQVLAVFPYAEFAYIIENDFERIKEDRVLADFGRSPYVIPILSAEAVKAGKEEKNDSYVVYAKKDTAFLKDEKLRQREKKLAEEELQSLKEKIYKISVRKDIIWNDYMCMQEFAKSENESEKKQCDTLYMQLENVKKQALKLQKEIETLDGKQAEQKKQKEQLEKELCINQQRYPYMEKTSQLSQKLSGLYCKKQEHETQASQAEQEMLLKEQKMKEEDRAAKEAAWTEAALLKECKAMQKRWEKCYYVYDKNHSDNNKIKGLQQESLEVLEGRFAGVKKALDEKNSDIGDKEALLQHYRTAMEKCRTAIKRRHFTIEEMAEKETGTYENTEALLLGIEEEKEKSHAQAEAADRELEAQNALMNRLQGSITHGKTQIQEKYGEFKEFSCDNYEQFIAQHRQYREQLVQQQKDMKKTQQLQEEKMRDILVMEKDLSRIIEKAGLEVPEMTACENMETTQDFSGYEEVQKSFEKICMLEVRKLEEFMKRKERLSEALSSYDGKELAAEIKISVNVPKDIADVKQLKLRISETNTLIALEKERVSKGIEDMERIKDNFENRCVQICCNIKTELDRLPKLSSITMDKEVISIIGLDIPYVKEDTYKKRMAAYIDETVLTAESFENAQERLKYIRNRLSWKRLFAVIVTDMNAVRVSLYKRERLKDQSRYLKYEEAVGSTGQSQGIYIQFLIAVINYISSINTSAENTKVLGKTIFIDNPFGAAKDIYIWEPIFKLLKTNHVQLIVPARGATPAITGRFDVNYILGQKLANNRQQTVVVDYYSKTKNEELEYTSMDYEQAVFDFI